MSDNSGVPYGYEKYAALNAPSMDKGEVEQLRNIAKCMVVWDGDLICKSSTRKLLARGYVERITGGFSITDKGSRKSA